MNLRGAIWLGLALAVAACGGGPRQPVLRFHSPLASTVWRPLAPRTTTEPPRSRQRPNPSQTRDRVSVPPDLRQRMVAEAQALLGSPGTESQGFFVADLSQILTNVVGRVGWQADRGLSDLLAPARRTDAYASDGEPEPGDIVLFHNQLDANGNGETDDWLTGCGIVVAVDDETFEAVVRTGHAPRRVSVSPVWPNRRLRRGELVNSYLRVPHPSDRADVQYLAGQLYAGHIDIEALVAGGQ